MFLYLVLLIIIVVTTFIATTKEYYNIRNYILIFNSSLLICFAGFRKMGFDYYSYKDIYERIPGLLELFANPKSIFNFEFNVEWIYVLTNSFFSSLGLSFEVFIFFIALLSVSLIAVSYKKLTNLYLWALVIYFARFFFLREMGQVRQGIAAGIVLLSIQFIIKKQFYKFLCTIIIASGFHSVALAAIPIYFIYHFNFNRCTILFSTILSIALGYIGVFTMFVETFQTILPSPIVRYTFSDSYGYSLGIFNPTALVQFIILIMMLVFKNKLKNKMMHYPIILNFYWVSTVVLFLFNDSAVIAARTSNVFTTVEPIIIVSFIYLVKNKLFGYFIIIIYYFLMLYLNLYSRLGDVYIPYESIFH
ncbi:EpsG family protein [Salibacterium salarium]|uniref:EpsG family protein n=1 Tax=Salibacterium salarium TaxID=284579 RepID=A0A3R9QG33_9BACI|nr:EpsG family protein [Salibacterium salarium]RSL29766.1 EpsG family protein [Salibacterium salarium]